jgi:hypothetical protein
LRAVLHFLESKIHSEVFPAGFAGELLYVSVFVVAYAPFDDLVGFAE